MAENLREYNFLPYAPSDPPVHMGGGFYSQRTAYESQVTLDDPPIQYIVATHNVYRLERMDFMNKCRGLVKYTKPEHDMFKTGDICLGHPSVYRGEDLPAKQRVDKHYYDEDESSISYRPGRDFRAEVMRDGKCIAVIKQEHIKGKIKHHWDNYLLYCMSMSFKGEPASGGGELRNRFGNKGVTSYVAFPSEHVGFMALELGALFGAYSWGNLGQVYDKLLKRELLEETGNGILVYHGPVLYVKDRNQWLHNTGVMKDERLHKIILSFVKPMEYSVEKEYRFCIIGPGLHKSKTRVIAPITTEFMGLAKYRGMLVKKSASTSQNTFTESRSKETKISKETSIIGGHNSAKPTFTFIRKDNSINWRIEYCGETVGSCVVGHTGGENGTWLHYGSPAHSRLYMAGHVEAFWAAANYFLVDKSHGRDGTPAVNKADNTKVIARVNRVEYSVEYIEGNPTSISTFFGEPFEAEGEDGKQEGDQA